MELRPSQENRSSVRGSAGFYLFEDDVDVTSDELGDLLPLCGLNRVVTILVVSKVLRGRSSLVNMDPPGKTAPRS